jgi:hypothetical protein
MDIRTSASLSSLGVVVLVLVLIASPGLAGTTDNEGLRSAEVEASQVASRSFFAAQRAERRDAEEAGLVALAEEVKALRASVRDLRRLEDEADLSGSGFELLAADGTPVPIAAATATAVTARRDRADSEFRERRKQVRAKRRALRSNLAQIKTHKQRLIAQAALRSLDRLDPEFGVALTGTRGERRERLQALDEKLGGLEQRVQASSAPDGGQPNMTTIVRHRNPIRRKP